MKKNGRLWIVITLITLISLVFINSYKTLEKPKFFVEEYSVTESFITKEQLLEDYDMMWKLIEDNYPFLNTVQYAAYGPELDLPKVRDNNREMITNLYIDYFSYEMVYELLSDVIKPFQGIGHLFVIDSEFYSLLITIFSDERTHNLMPLSERIYKQLMNPQVKKFYGELSKLNNNENLQFNLKDEIEEVNLYQKVSDSVDTWVKDEIAYVSIAQFWSEWELGEMLIEILQQFFEENKGAEHIIIDIQGNPGGNTMVWERGIIFPLWQEPLENYSIMGMLTGDLNRFFWAGDLPDISDLDEIYTADDLTGQHLFPEFEITNVDEMVYIKSSVRIENRPEEAVGFDGKLWLLIDGNVYSAADALAHFSKGSGFATLVGTRTLGGGVGSQPYVMSLPNSGLSIYYDAFLGFNHDGTVNGIIGTPPDIEVQEGQMALEVVLEEISRLGSLP